MQHGSSPSPESLLPDFIYNTTLSIAPLDRNSIVASLYSYASTRILILLWLNSTLILLKFSEFICFFTFLRNLL